jgi:hypothetical protein
MRSARGKVIILVVLAVVWALVLVTRHPSEPPAQARAQAARPARTPAAPGGEGPRLKLELLNLPRGPYPAEEQSIFGVPPPPPPPPPRPGESAQSAAPAAPPPDPFQEEARQLRFVGFLRDGSTATAFLVQGQQVHTVAVGGLVGGRFRVTDVGEDFVVLASPAGDKQVRLPLVQEAGSVPRPPAPGGPPGPVGPPGMGR